MSKALMPGLLAAAMGMGLVAVPAHGQDNNQMSGDTAKCWAAASDKAIGTANVSTQWIEANAAKGLPAYCEVTATLSPVPGSKIGVVYRLPQPWNGKLLGLGGGGWAGNVTLGAAAAGLKAGYATAQTDGGHPSTALWDTRWIARPQAPTDFAYRAINQMTLAGKALVKSYYGTTQSHAYFQGCSTGGRMAMMEAQRFPDDYDGIIAGAPVYSLQVQTSAVLRNNVFARPGAAFTPAQLKLVNDAVLKACDAKDGLADGVIANPRACRWDPAALACPAGQGASPSCLGTAQVTALQTLYDGIRAPDGSWAMLSLNRGGELGWSLFITTDGTGNDQSHSGGMPGIAPLLFGDRRVDFAKLDPNSDVPEARASAFARMYEATDPDLAPFFGHGGKLLMWHGQSDPGPSPVATADYVTAAQQRDPAGAQAGLRLFMLPGVGHCWGGPGADQVDTLAALDQWVEQDMAPETLVAHRADGKMTRPLCAWPSVAHYLGKGDPNAPESYTCEAPAGD